MAAATPLVQPLEPRRRLPAKRARGAAAAAVWDVPRGLGFGDVVPLRFGGGVRAPRAAWGSELAAPRRPVWAATPCQAGRNEQNTVKRDCPAALLCESGQDDPGPNPHRAPVR